MSSDKKPYKWPKLGPIAQKLLGQDKPMPILLHTQSIKGLKVCLEVTIDADSTTVSEVQRAVYEKLSPILEECDGHKASGQMQTFIVLNIDGHNEAVSEE